MAILEMVGVGVSSAVIAHYAPRFLSWIGRRMMRQFRIDRTPGMFDTHQGVELVPVDYEVTQGSEGVRLHIRFRAINYGRRWIHLESGEVSQCQIGSAATVTAIPMMHEYDIAPQSSREVYFAKHLSLESTQRLVESGPGPYRATISYNARARRGWRRVDCGPMSSRWITGEVGTLTLPAWMPASTVAYD